MELEKDMRDVSRDDEELKDNEILESLEEPEIKKKSQSDNKKAEENNKMTKKQIIGLVILSLIAIGGVLFGIYGMNSQNDQIVKLNERATEAEKKIAQLETNEVEVVSLDEGTAEIVDSVSNYKNPVIKSLDSEVEYGVYFYSESIAESKQRLRIMVNDGEISSCSVETPVDEYSWNSTECNINGLSGKIYKIVEFGAGQMNIDDQVGFIMTDGTVQYLPLYESVEKNDFSIRGTMKLDNYVVDAFRITVGSTVHSAGGYMSTVFVMGDGSYVKYDESMLK